MCSSLSIVKLSLNYPVVGRGTEVLSIVKLPVIFEFIFYILYANSCVGRGTEVLSIVKLPVIFEFILYIICKQLCCREFVLQVAGGTVGRRQHCQRWWLAEVFLLTISWK
jgi:hypothetical protein